MRLFRRRSSDSLAADPQLTGLRFDQVGGADGGRRKHALCVRCQVRPLGNVVVAKLIYICEHCLLRNRCPTVKDPNLIIQADFWIYEDSNFFSIYLRFEVHPSLAEIYYYLSLRVACDNSQSSSSSLHKFSLSEFWMFNGFPAPDWRWTELYNAAGIVISKIITFPHRKWSFNTMMGLYDCTWAWRHGNMCRE